MDLNVSTLAVALSITNFMQVVIMFSLYRRNEASDGPGWWTIGGMCAALGFALFEFRNAPVPFGYMAIVANNALLVIALSFVYAGVRRFFDRRVSVKVLVLFCTVFVLLNIYFTVPPHYNYRARRTILLAGVAVVTLLIGAFLFKQKGKPNKVLLKILSVGFSLFGVAAAAGIAATLTIEKLSEVNTNDVMQTGMYLGTIIASTLWTFGFITLVNQRINTQSIEARERFESIFNTSPDGVFISSLPEGVIWNVNEGFTKLTGYSKEETTGKTSLILDLYENADDRRYVGDTIIKTGICENFETTLKKKNGETVTVLLSAKKVSLRGSPHDICVIRDISERKLSEVNLKKTKERYHLLFENAVETVVVAQNTRIKLCNPIAEALTGYSRDELLGLKVFDLIYPEDKQFVIKSHTNRTGDKNEVVSYDCRVVAKDGAVKWIQVKSIMIEWDEKPATLNFLTDISDRKQAILDLVESEAKYRLITEFASDVIWVLNLTKNEYTYISPSVAHLRGYTPEEAKALGVVKSFTPESMEVVKYSVVKNLEHFKAKPKAANHYTNELQQTCKDGSTVWVEESTKYRYNAAGEIEIVGVTRNIEDRKKTEQEILYLSYHDQLTGLKNRRYFDELIKDMENKKCIPLTLIMADVNGLKLTNDAFGHKTGDGVLTRVAAKLKSHCREGDTVARIGGDEFVLVLPETDTKTAETILQNINKSIAAEQSENITLSVSIGFAVRSKLTEEISEVFKKAEDDMYRHKLAESSSIRSNTIRVIMNTLYEKNNREMLHSKRVGELCELIAQKLNLDKNAVDQLRLAGLMHDIGKIGIDEKILNNPLKLKKDELAEVRRHSEIGYRILSSVNEFSEIADCILEHHERWDGKGYPRGLKGEKISLQARIICLADSYDAITSDRTYRAAMSKSDAVAEIIKCAGTQFDPRISRVFVEEVLCGKWRKQ